MDLDLRRALKSQPKEGIGAPLFPLTTIWGESLLAATPGDGTVPWPEHPRPQLARTSWQTLNGWWDYAFVSLGSAQEARSSWRNATMPISWDGKILVPFSPEAQLSHVGRQLKPNELLWYRLCFDASRPLPGRRRILHFEGVDWACAVYLNGKRLAEHRGCYLPFDIDVTSAVKDGENALAVCVFDPSDTGTQLRGKQRLVRANMWYTAQSGIWQSVWIEDVPKDHVRQLRVSANPDDGTISVTAQVSHPGRRLVLSLESGRSAMGPVAKKHEATVRLRVQDPQLWEPDNPRLYDLTLGYGEDEVTSYCAFRSVTVEPDAQGTPRVMLNHKPVFLRGLLDQGYWPDGLMTPPSLDALRSDVQSAHDLGFNLLRKHVKVEGELWYWLCDRMGVLVIQDMPTGGGSYDKWRSINTPTLFRRSWSRFRDDTPSHWRKLAADDNSYRREWQHTRDLTVRRLSAHPSVIAWTLFNESWGQFDSFGQTQRTRELDPTRPVIAASGWYDQGAGNFVAIHNYFRSLQVYPHKGDRAFILNEFGGLSLRVEGHCSLETSYGYDVFEDTAAFRQAVSRQLAQADALEPRGLAGFVFTQLTDIEEETNGLLSYDRRVSKLPVPGTDLRACPAYPSEPTAHSPRHSDRTPKK